MPIMNSLALLKALRSDTRLKTIPVVMYSTSINPHDEKQCDALGAEYCIQKPVTLEGIIGVGKTLLALCQKRDPLVAPGIS